MDIQAWSPLFGVAGVGLAAAFVVSLRVRLRARAAVGTRVHARSAGGVPRVLTLLALVAASSWLVATTGELPPLVLAPVALGAASLLLEPSASSSVCGTDGVQQGWTVRSFRDLEEWRLAGEHLRFRIGSRWLAIELPPEHHEATLARLRTEAGERESRFK